MSLFFAAALLASAATTVPQCSWDKPGAQPFMGDVVASVDRYSDIPEDVRANLKRRMAARQYDELVTIRRDAIVGQQQRYDPQIRDMHFGDGRVCRTVTRAKWSNASQERGLVYCDGGQCLLVPTVCRNLSRVTRVKGSDGVGARGPLPGPVESAGGSIVTLAGGAPGLAADTGLGRPMGMPGDVGGDVFVPAPLALAQPAPTYPTVQGPVGGITIFPPVSTPAVPEPSTVLLWLLGGAGVAVVQWRRRHAAATPADRPIP